MQLEILYTFYNSNNYLTDQTSHINQLPIIQFSLNISKDSGIAEEMKLGSKYCPHYIIISSNLTSITSFIDIFKNSLSRRHSRYALIFSEGDRFSATTFLHDNSHFKKVLNLAVIVMPMVFHNTPGNAGGNIPHNKR